MALKISQNQPPISNPFFQPPLYFYFLGLLYSIFGADLLIVRYIQLFISILNLILTFYLAKRVFNIRIAAGSGIVMALYGTLIFFENELLAPVLIIFFNLLLIHSLLKFFHKPDWKLALLCGILLALSAITMSVILPFGILIIIFSYFYYQREKSIKPDFKKKILLSLSFAFGFLVIVSPVSLYNYHRSGNLILISTNGGINFYLGNGRNFKEKVAIRPGLEWNNLMREPYVLGYQTPRQKSSYYFNKAKREAFQDPLGFFQSILQKFFQFANGNEIMRNQEIYPFRKYSPLLSTLTWKNKLAVPFGILFPLALLGIFYAFRNRIKDSYLILILILSHIGITVLFFVTARYRMNIIPFLIIMAVYGAGVLIKFFKQKKYRNAIVSTFILFALILFCNWKVGSMPKNFTADTYFNLGTIYQSQNNSQAESMFKKSLAVDPDYLDSYLNLCRIKLQKGDHRGAAEGFRKIIKKYPYQVIARQNLGIALFSMGKYQESIEEFKKVLTYKPDDPISLNNIKVIEGKVKENDTRRLQSYLQKIQKELDKDADNPKLLSDIGMTLILLKDFQAAENYLIKAIRLNPQIPQTHNNLGVVYMQRRETKKAEEQFKIALKLKPDYQSPQKNLKNLRKSKNSN
jgi:tetratricopeptide (TPR) repeat protein